VAAAIQGTCQAIEGIFGGPCRYDPGFVIPNMDIRVAPAPSDGAQPIDGGSARAGSPFFVPPSLGLAEPLFSIETTALAGEQFFCQHQPRATRFGSHGPSLMLHILDSDIGLQMRWRVMILGRFREDGSNDWLGTQA
jgi:hypothetical protein